MKIFLSTVLFLTILVGCKNDDSQRLEAQRVAEIKQDSIFKEITKYWQFKVPSQETKANEILQSWPQWKEFSFELRQKPGIDLTNFRNKAALLSTKIKLVLATLPQDFRTKAIMSRFLVLQTNINALELYLNLDAIPLEKLRNYCNEINETIAMITIQMDAIYIRAAIPLEEGELETRQQLQDTTRLANKIPPKDLDFE